MQVQPVVAVMKLYELSSLRNDILKNKTKNRIYNFFC